MWTGSSGVPIDMSKMHATNKYLLIISNFGIDVFAPKGKV
jgi:hypothetical protein